MAEVMTIGTLSRRSGVPVKTLRTYEDMGLIYTVGRPAAARQGRLLTGREERRTRRGQSGGTAHPAGPNVSIC